MLYVPFLNYAEGSLDAARAMIVHPLTVPGLSDGGAHVGMICDGSFPTTMLTHWTRDRTRGPKLPLGRRHPHADAGTPRALLGLGDRGVVRRATAPTSTSSTTTALALHAPEVAYDLPAGGRRLIQRASGYAATIVAGEVTYRDGEATGALPGRLIRGAQPAPMALAAE